MGNGETDRPSEALPSVVALMDLVRAVSQRGLAYAQDRYDRERYETLANAVAVAYADLTGIESGAVRERFVADIGYPTAKVGADAAVFSDDKLLVIRRADSGRWALPGGWVDPGESPERTAARETGEETMLAVEPVEVIGVHTQVADPDRGPHSSVHVLVHCRLCAAIEARAPTAEASEVHFVDPTTISEWESDHGVWAAAAMRWWRERGEGML